MKLGNLLKIAICSLALSQTLTPAHAVMLHGSVQTADFTSAQPMPLAASLSANQQRAARASILEGTWQCVSQVVASNVPGVAPGNVVQSAMQYSLDRTGNMVGHWQQDQWSPASSAVVKIDSDLLTSSRESVNAGAGGRAWSARSHDMYKIIAPNKMLAQSIVEQFVNGQFVGKYKTASILQKVGG